MKIAVISDIHGNIPALEAVLSDIKARNIQKIFCLGDLAGKGPDSALAVDIIREDCESIVKGNWDYYLTEKKSDMLLWHQDQLGRERLAFMKDLPEYLEFYMSGKLIRLCHASPHNLHYRTYVCTDWDERLRLFEPTKTLDRYSDVIGYGDIHGAYVEFKRGKTFFNTGSVGNPLELTQSSYAIIEGEYESEINSPFTISIARIPYDIDQAVFRAEASDMPDKREYINELRTAKYRGHNKFKK